MLTKDPKGPIAKILPIHFSVSYTEVTIAWQNSRILYILRGPSWIFSIKIDNSSIYFIKNRGEKYNNVFEYFVRNLIH